MELERMLKEVKDQVAMSTREEKIIETIQKSKEAFILAEQEQHIGYLEFVINQLYLIRKRWWLFQALLLGVAAITLPYMQDKVHMVRVLGVIGVLFVVLIIPEFWKNRNYGCMQVEGTCFYSLRQIYAARMLWIGVVDMFLLTCFCLVVRGNLLLATSEVLIQFLFPTLIASCICFGTLCGSRLLNEATAISFCLLWSGLWSVVILNETIYSAITLPVWTILFILSLVYLIAVIYRTIYSCNRFWEVNINAIRSC